MIRAFDLSVTVFVRGLENLRGVLQKGQRHATAVGIDPAALLAARLADDMNDLSVQAHWAAEGAKIAVARMLGADGAALPEPAKTFEEIDARLAATIAALAATSPADLEARLGQPIDVPMRGGAKRYSAEQFLTEFAIPGFFFHLTTAYCILRAQGVPLTKGDFLGA